MNVEQRQAAADPLAVSPPVGSYRLQLSSHFFNPKLLLDNSASFTSSRMKDLYVSKMESKTNFSRRLLTDTDLNQYFTTDLRYSVQAVRITAVTAASHNTATHLLNSKTSQPLQYIHTVDTQF